METVGKLETAPVEAALAYAKRGWKVFPVFEPVFGKDGSLSCACGNPHCGDIGKHPRTPHGFKEATSDRATIEEWRTAWPNANVGIATGKASGLLVIDVDGPEGQAALNELQEQHGCLPLTLQAKTGKGFHLYFRLPEEVRIPSSTGRLGRSIDVRGESGYVVAPPSRHASGITYAWENEGTELAMLPPEWVEQLKNAAGTSRLKGETRMNKTKNEEKGTIPEGTRNSTLFERAALLNSRGVPQEEIGESVRQWNEAECSVPLGDCELERLMHSAAAYGRPRFPLTDMGNAERFVANFKDVVRYCDDLGKWFCYENGKWHMDKGNRVTEFAKVSVRSILHEAAELRAGALYRELLSHARKSESARSLNGIVSLAKSDPQIAVSLEAFDADPLLLNVQNGEVDLRTGELRPHSPENLCTRMAKVAYDGKAECPEFLNFLDTVTEGSRELTRYLQTLAGYCLTGLVSEQAFFIIVGKGANGKSTLARVMTELLGDYAMTTPASTFVLQRNESIRNDLARLKGARLVVTSEFDHGQAMSEALLKQITGGEKITARFLMGEYFEYDPIFKILSTTNHLPRVRGMDTGIWRRIQPIPFNHQVPDNQQDKRLFDKLLLELPGILNWAVEGCRIWQSEGLQKPECVKGTVEEYKSDMDRLSDFFDQRVEFVQSSNASTANLYRVYKEWAGNAGEEVVSMKHFSLMLKERGYTKKRDRDMGVVWLGLRLKSADAGTSAREDGHNNPFD